MVDLFSLTDTVPLHADSQIAEALHIYITDLKDAETQSLVHFGSTLDGTYGPHSDIDLLTINHKGPPAGKTLIFHRGFRYDVMSIKASEVFGEIERDAIAGRTFLSSAASNGRCIWGDVELFADLMGAVSRFFPRLPPSPAPKSLKIWRSSLLALLFNIQKDTPTRAANRMLSAYELLFRVLCATESLWPDKGRYARNAPRAVEDDPFLSCLRDVIAGDVHAATCFIYELYLRVETLEEAS